MINKQSASEELLKAVQEVREVRLNREKERKEGSAKKKYFYIRKKGSESPVDWIACEKTKEDALREARSHFSYFDEEFNISEIKSMKQLFKITKEAMEERDENFERISC